MVRMLLLVAALFALGSGISACADGEQLRADRMAAAEAEDDAACREKGEPGTEFYEECRQSLAAARAQTSAIKEQKARDFDRILGAGTSGLSDKY